MKKLFIAILVIALVGGGWVALSKKAFRRETSDPIPARFVARAEKRDIDSTVEVSGDVTPEFQLDVKPEVGGKLKKLNVQVGSEVKEGDLLVEIDDRDLLTEKASALTEIEGARLTMDKAQNNFNRAKELFAGKLISHEVYDNLSSELSLAENGLVRAQRKLEVVEDKLRKTKVLSPTDGTVLTVPVIEGQVVIAAASVNSGTSLMTIANLSRLLVETHINQVDVAHVEKGETVKLHAESIPDADMEATIARIALVASVKNNVKGFSVQALIEKPDPRLRSGMSVNMIIPIASANDVISVPISAVFKGEGNKKVIYVRNGTATEKREVKIGVTNTDFVQVLNGVSQGEEILLVEPVRSGMKKS